MLPFGFFRLAVASPTVQVAAPKENVRAISAMVQRAGDVDCLVLPELSISAYSCGDLFATTTLLQQSLDALADLLESTVRSQPLIVVGMPLVVGTSLYNVAIVIQQGHVLGIVPKTYLPNYREFYEQRWFRAAGSPSCRIAKVDQVVLPHPRLENDPIPFGTDLLFQSGQAIVGIEICEDLWTPIPPSSYQAIAGANVLLNLSASNETIGKSRWRGDLVVTQSGRCIAAYAYASAGPGESTTDLVFGGHCLIAENGSVLCQAKAIEQTESDPQILLTADVDLERLDHDRRVQNSFADFPPERLPAFRHIPFTINTETRADVAAAPHREIDGTPFVPRQSADLEARCAEIFSIQVAGLLKRVQRLPASMPLAIGVSGGLDSTLALLVAAKMCDRLDAPQAGSRILGITMPGFGTSRQTRVNAIALMTGLGITQAEMDIRAICLDTFRSLGHRPLGLKIDDSTTVDSLHAALASDAAGVEDLVFENVQARVRTLLLMSRGFVLGTGDLSEQALGWSTYNGDHMSMYNVNTSIPKTLIRFLVRHAADNYFAGALRETLHAIADTPISPELLPLSASGQIRQHTEQTLGSYELHDFFLYYFIRFGFDRAKLRMMASRAIFPTPHRPAEIERALEIFFSRFVSQQFKRSCVPDGPKVGSVSLSPRGDWRMPSDADISL